MNRDEHPVLADQLSFVARPTASSATACLASQRPSRKSAACAGRVFSECVQMALNEVHPELITQKVRKLTRRVGLRYPEANVRFVSGPPWPQSFSP